MTQNQSRPLFFQQQQSIQFQPQQHLQPAAAALYNDSIRHNTASPFEATTDSMNALDFGLDLDLDTSNLDYGSLSASPISTLSQLSQYSPLSAFDSIPTPTLAEPSLFPAQRQSRPVNLFTNTDAMQTESWMQGSAQPAPRSAGHFSHQRDSSRSSMGSNGPLSPYSHNVANPQIAMNDSVGEHFHALHGADDLNGHYQLAAAKSFPGVSHDNFYTGGLPSYGSGGDTTTNNIPSYSYLATTAPRRRNDRNLLPEHPAGPRSQAASVASSVVSDSPATPAGEPEEDRKRTTALHPVPKLDRTMTDAYADELYSPNFAITSPSSGQASSISPTSDLFTQRIQAANNQHLSAVTNSPVSSASRDRSPFRQGSPLAPMPMSDFRSAMGNGPASQVRFNTAQQLREQSKAMRDAQAVQQQISRPAADTVTPQTISPKDAMLEFHEAEGDVNNFPLFPRQHNNASFNADAISKATAAQSQQVFGGGMHMDTNSFNNFLGAAMPAPVQMHPQYPFMAQQRPHSAVPSAANTSMGTTRLGSAETGITDSVHGSTPQRPSDTRADGGTYTCTYHGCTLRFETPALLQKHKREGHRQAHGLTSVRRPETPTSMTSSTLLNTQAGPHRCDRINPSTGKPCNTVFSRPYDLTRHEHTIHNARKQKVRCDLCTDDKTFSRADALTRHYRVCHPDVEFPGKQRRRGGHS
ncbi:hypothetical protein B0J18DRAFT_222085 [Chaetomium sp. MPI-SDFR-AT-0129]|nr:hypothetical protein B0J18DRAFT_222085 [Chaetomium sp. MPI-SDFR-AT-0129]